jgi:hypothetical protein
MSWFGNKSSGSQSNAGASTQAQNDVNNGYGKANTHTVPAPLAETYNTNYDHQKKEAERRRNGG